MLIFYVHRKSPWVASCRVVHIDYGTHPSRSWEVCLLEVPTSPLVPADEAVKAVARALLGKAAPAVADDLESGRVYVQPELPLQD